jgi:hypothetical protein
VNGSLITGHELSFTAPVGEEMLNHYFYVRAVNVLGQEGYFTDLASATDFRFATQPEPPNYDGPKPTCD